jgi:hypothetical protein
LSAPDRGADTANAARAYKLWAIASSALCAVLIAYIVASHATAPDGDGQPAAEAAPAPDPSGIPTEVPAALRGLPTEWVHRAAEDARIGWSVVLDPTGTRELIAERCTHRGYFDLDAGTPRDTDWRFCETVLAGSIVALDDDELAVRAPTGEIRRVGYAVEGTPDTPRLVLVLGGRPTVLVPGTRNDLYQQMDRVPAIRAEHEALLRHMAEPRPEPAGPARSSDR